MEDQCTKATEEQIKVEVSAAMKYLSMGAHFAKDNVNRPGFAKFFFDAASEEREHATKLIEYLAMRSRYLNDKKGKPTGFSPNLAELVKGAEKAEALGDLKLEKLTESNSGLKALQNALKMEVAVTQSIRSLMEKCEKADDFNDFHVSF
jgi:ferritin heavy chain